MNSLVLLAALRNFCHKFPAWLNWQWILMGFVRLLGHVISLEGELSCAHEGLHEGVCKQGNYDKAAEINYEAISLSWRDLWTLPLATTRSRDGEFL